MTDFEFTCPPMIARNSSIWNPYAQHTADKLTATGKVWKKKFDLTFDACTITYVGKKKEYIGSELIVWMVSPVHAQGNLENGASIWFDFPQEPVVKRGRLRVAMPITSIRGSVSGIFAQAVLPEAPADPGKPFGTGLWEMVVRQVICPARVFD